MFGESTPVFLHNLGSRIGSAKGDVRERTCLIQRISLANVSGNAISIAMSYHRSFSPRVMIIFVSQCAIIIMFGCKLLMKLYMFVKNTLVHHLNFIILHRNELNLRVLFH